MEWLNQTWNYPDDGDYTILKHKLIEKLPDWCKEKSTYKLEYYSQGNTNTPFNCIKNRGRRCSMVFSLPSMGDRPMMTEARADLTCWLASATRSFTQGSMLFMIICSRTSDDSAWQNSGKQKTKNPQLMSWINTYLIYLCYCVSENLHNLAGCLALAAGNSWKTQHTITGAHWAIYSYQPFLLGSTWLLTA